MKTREEIQKELDNKKETSELSEIKTIAEDLKVEINNKIARLQNFKPEVTHSYRLSDEVPLKELKTAIFNLGRELVNFKKIPERIELETTHRTDKVSHKFLWRYFAVSSLIIALSVGYGVYQHYNSSDVYNDIEALKKEAFNNGFQKGYQDTYKILPDDSQKFLRNNYPKVFK